MINVEIMQLLSILAVAGAATAFVLPDQQLMSTLEIKSRKSSDSVHRTFPSPLQIIKALENQINHAAGESKNILDQALSSVVGRASRAADSIQSTYSEVLLNAQDGLSNILGGGDHPPHHGGPHNPHHGHKPNQTIYQLISGSKYTTKLAELIDEDEELVKVRNLCNHWGLWFFPGWRSRRC